MEKQGLNPVTGAVETAKRRALRVEDRLPLREEYAAFIARLLEEAQA